ncbi:hypothetical protein [Corynebacterium terpenotabidum]|uniref:Uncharacterized protein n=1 Tax=Corynebacterium terpenotabidum Y-11 TaxID=1200352 RepID=S4XBX5_9CORY|nr:hypothetical protein [Corynebacterium terpenotabidum]AGP30091.1 hypothetical protein A606_02190 [Corynebacterium terpenotabidum Y-11]
MPPKVTENQTTSAESLHTVESETAAAAQRIVASYATDNLDAATLMCMLGVEPEGLIHRKVAAEFAEPEPEKKTRKKAAKKTTKKAAAKKTTAKKTTKKAAASTSTDADTDADEA